MTTRFLLGFLLLAACAPSATRLERSSLSNTTVLSNFVPDKGEGASYKINEQVRFKYTLSAAGFITALSYGATGNTEPLEVNISVRAGQSQLPRPDDRVNTKQAAYIVGAPTGTNRVVLIYTNRPLNAAPRGRLDAQGLQAAIKNAIEVSGADRTDIAETHIEVTP
jgi:hypothetical protein